MKVLIWFGCIFVATILNTLLGYVTGIKAGYLVMYFGVYFVARKLCQKWDERKKFKVSKSNDKSGLSADPIYKGLGESPLVCDHGEIFVRALEELKKLNK